MVRVVCADILAHLELSNNSDGIKRYVTMHPILSWRFYLINVVNRRNAVYSLDFQPNSSRLATGGGGAQRKSHDVHVYLLICNYVRSF